MTLNIPKTWRDRVLNKPWEEGSKIFISIRGDRPMALTTSMDYFSEAANIRALNKIYDYYGKQVNLTNTSPLVHEDTRAPGRISTPVLLYSLERSILDSAPNLKFLEGGDPIAHTKSISIRFFMQRIKQIAPIFRAYHGQYKYFNGRVSPGLNFVQEYNSLEIAYEHLREFVRFNGYKFRIDEDDKIILSFAEDFSFVEVGLERRGRVKTLLKGNDFYLKDTSGLKDKQTNRLLYNLFEIAATRRAPLLWTQFVETYIPSVTIDYFGKARSDTPANELIAYAESRSKLYQTAEQSKEEQEKIEDPITIGARLVNEALSEHVESAVAKVGKDMQKLKDKLDVAEQKAEIVRDFINTWGIDRLIMAALECLALRTGMPHDALMKIPGLNPFDLVPPPLILKLPKLPMDFPPIVSINAPITAAIKENLRDAAEQAVVGILETLADIIVRLCQPEEDEEAGTSSPLNNLVNDFPSPNKFFEDDIENSLFSCYEDFGMTPETGNYFLERLAGRLAPRETCDLINGAPSSAVIEIVYDLIDQEETLNFLREHFTSNSLVISFFMCVGELISPDYCSGIYSQPPFEVPDCDPCRWEELLIDSVDNDIFDALLDYYNNLDNFLPEPLNLECGGPILPALSDRPALQHALKSSFGGLFEVPKTTFVNDITNIKTILLVTDYSGVSDDQRRANLERADSISQSQEGSLPEPPDLSATEQNFLSSLLPEALQNMPMAQNVQAAVNSAMDQENRLALSQVKYTVAPDYRNNLASLDTRFVSPWYAYEDDSEGSYKRMFFSLEDGATGDTIYYSIASDTPSGVLPATLITSSGDTAAIEEVLTGYEVNRKTYADRFADTVCNPYLTNIIDLSPGVIGGAQLGFGASRDALKAFMSQHNFFRGNQSLLNSLAYNIRNSTLFDPDNFKRFSLLPVPCSDGTEAPSGEGLVDWESVVESGLQEFEDNSCTDRSCVVGPVEDALIFAVANAYIQVLLVEQLFKNLFLVDVYGLSNFINTPMVMNKIIDEIYESIRRGQYGEEVLRNLTRAATIYLDKVRERQPVPNTLPDPYGTSLAIEIPSEYHNYEEQLASYEDYNPYTGYLDGVFVGPDHPAEVLQRNYGRFAFEYLIKKQTVRMIPAFQRLFTSEGEEVEEPILDFNKQLVINGIPVMNVFDHGGKEDIMMKFRGSINDNIPIVVPTLPTMETSFNYGIIGDAGSLGASEDEVQYARSSGLFATEKYISFEYDHAALMALQTSVSSSEVLMFNELKEFVLGHNNLDSSANYGLIPRFGGIPDYSGIGSEESQVFQAAEAGVATPTAWSEETAGSGPAQSTYPQDGNASLPVVIAHEHVTTPEKWIVSFDNFNNFITKIRNSNAAEIEAAMEVDEIAGKFQGITVTYLVELGRRVDVDEGALVPFFGLVKGPVTENNYDAIRFWVNEVQSLQHVGSTITIPSTNAIVGTGQPERPEYIGETVRAPNSLMWARGRPGTWGELDAGYTWPFNWSGAMNFISTEVIVDETTRYDNLHERIGVDWTRDTTVPNDGIDDSEQGDSLYGRISYRPKASDLFDLPWESFVWRSAYGDDGEVRYHGLDAYNFRVHAIYLSDDDWASAHREIPLSELLSGPTVGGVLVGTMAQADTSTDSVMGNGGDDTYDPAPFGPSLYVTGLKEYDAALSKIIFNIKMGTRIVYYSPIVTPEDGLGKALFDVLSTSGVSAAQQKLHYWKTKSDFLAAQGDGYIWQCNTGIKSEILIYDNLTQINFNRSVAAGQRANLGAPLGAYYSNQASGPVAGLLVNDTLAHNFGPLPPGAYTGSPITAERRDQIYDVDGLPDPAGGTMLRYSYWGTPDGPVSKSEEAVLLAAGTITDIEAYGSLYGDPNSYDILTPHFKVNRYRLAEEMVTQEDFKTLFNDTYSGKSLISLLFMYGLLSADAQSSKYSSIFSDTKMTLRMILRAALAGERYDFKDPEGRDASQQARDDAMGLVGAAAAPFAGMGASFVLKMLIETPIRILKGLAEMIDPHVAIGKTIKDGSGQVIDVASKAWDMGTTIAGIGEAVATSQGGAEIPPDVQALLDMGLEEVIQMGIDEDFADLPPILRPKVNNGIDLIGSLPWLFGVPPTPLGIAYILLNLNFEDMALEKCRRPLDDMPNPEWAPNDPLSQERIPDPNGQFEITLKNPATGWTKSYIEGEFGPLPPPWLNPPGPMLPCPENCDERATGVYIPPGQREEVAPPEPEVPTSTYGCQDRDEE